MSGQWEVEIQRGYLFVAGVMCSLLAIGLAMAVANDRREQQATVTLMPGFDATELFEDGSDPLVLKDPITKVQQSNPINIVDRLPRRVTTATEVNEESSANPSTREAPTTTEPTRTTSSPTTRSPATTTTSLVTTPTGPTTSTTAPTTTTASTTTTTAAPTTAPTTTTTLPTTTTTTTSPTTTTTLPTTTTTIEAEVWTQIVIPTAGGSIVVSYRPGEVRLDAASPAPTFILEDVVEEPKRVQVQFEGDDVTYTLEAKWEKGELVTDVDASGPGAD